MSIVEQIIKFDIFSKLYDVISDEIEKRDPRAIILLQVLNTYNLEKWQKIKCEELALMIDAFLMPSNIFFDKYYSKNKIDIAQISQLLVPKGLIKELIEISREFINNGIYDEDEIIITRLTKTIIDIEKHQKRVDDFGNKENYDKIILREKLTCITKNIDTLFSDAHTSLIKDGAYAYRPKKIEKISTFLSDFSNNKNIDLYRKKKFDREVVLDAVDKCFVLKKSRLCGYEGRTWACFDQNDSYIPTSAAKLASITRSNIAQKVDKEIDFAYCLPFAWQPSNYYHFIAETIYGLRFVNKFRGNFPILYSEDKFGVLSYFAEKLGIDIDRLKNVRDNLTSEFQTLILPDKPPYYWDRKMFQFFNQFSAQDEKTIDIYISRENSNDSRKLKNESQLQNILERENFQIVHLENLKIRDQIELFSKAKRIIAPHGAGLTNILFCSPGIELVELFSENYIVPDFYLRSRHLNCRYSPLLCSDNIININDLLKLIR